MNAGAAVVASADEVARRLQREGRERQAAAVARAGVESGHADSGMDSHGQGQGQGQGQGPSSVMDSDSYSSNHASASASASASVSVSGSATTKEKEVATLDLDLDLIRKTAKFCYDKGEDSVSKLRARDSALTVMPFLFVGGHGYDEFLEELKRLRGL